MFACSLNYKISEGSLLKIAVAEDELSSFIGAEGCSAQFPRGNAFPFYLGAVRAVSSLLGRIHSAGIPS